MTDKKIIPLTNVSLKKGCDKGVLKLRKEVSFSICPKCGLNTLGKIDNISICINCE